MAEGGSTSRFKSCRHYQRRLATFDRWPEDTGQTAEHLAKEGFIHTGKGDEVECVYCGIRFFDWNAREDPTKLHFDKSKGLCLFAKKRIKDRRSQCYGSIWESSNSTSISQQWEISYVRPKSSNSFLLKSYNQNAPYFPAHMNNRTENSSGFGPEISKLSNVATNAVSREERTQTAGAKDDRKQLHSYTRGNADNKNKLQSNFINHQHAQSDEERNEEKPLPDSDEMSQNPTQDPSALRERKPQITIEKQPERDPWSVTQKLELVSPKEPDASAMLAMSDKDTSFMAAKGIPDKYYVNSFMDTDVVRLVMKIKDWSARLLREVIQKGLAAGEEVFVTAERLTKAVYDYIDQHEASKDRPNPQHDPNR